MVVLVNLTAEQVEEIKDLLDRHDEDSDCNSTGGCCSGLLIEYIRDLLDVE